jgi:hypothetical protein
VTVAPAPIALSPPSPPDSDFDSALAKGLDVVTRLAGSLWTDHNLPDPGITLLELVAFSLADLHYRTETRALDDWPLEAPVWRPAAERHWDGVAFPDPERMLELAELLSVVDTTGRTVAERIQRLVADEPSMTSATAAVADADWGAPLSWDEAATLTRLARRTIVDRAAYDLSDLVDAMLERSSGNLGEAARTLRQFPELGALFDEEIGSLIVRARSRAIAARVRELAGEIAALGDEAAATTLETKLTTGEGLSAEEARQAIALHPCPPGEQPELYEEANGSTNIWPPHSLQARTCEPVTAVDYARRARAAAGVRRAWAVPGRLAGTGPIPAIGWDGAEVTAFEDRPGTVTLLVEPEPPVEAAERLGFLKKILRAATTLPGEPAEVDDPYSTWRDDLDRASPRRLVCDELGVAFLRTCGVTLKATLHAPAGSERTDVLERALERVGCFFEDGRPESRVAADAAAACPGGIDGPWLPAPQPAGGWNPGEPIRVNELVEILAEDPAVFGVEDLELSIDGGPWGPGADDEGEMKIPIDCLPELTERQCVQVRLQLSQECAGA